MTTTSATGQAGQGPSDTVMASAIAAELERVRHRTLDLIAPLSDDLMARRPCEFMSPPVWDLGHIAEFERLWLVAAVEGRAHERLERRFDAELTPREERGALTLPGREEVLDGLARVRCEALDLLPAARLAGPDPLLRDGFVYRMVMQHEAQHQETLLQTLDLLDEVSGAGGRNEAVRDDAGSSHGAVAPRASAGPHAAAADDEERVTIPPGPFLMGTEDRSRAYDNERRRHEVELDSYEIERHLVSNRRWQAFIEDGGYRHAELWSRGGRQWLQEESPEAPQGWRRGDGGWQAQRFGRWRQLDPREAVQHVSYWEAEAFARWCGGRLPREAEWEKAASWAPRAGVPRTYPWGDEPAPGPPAGALPGAVEPDGPARIGSRPERASAYGVEDLLGSVYQWTASPFAPYPGFEAFPYAGYSEVFFGDRYRVLRGSSWAADPILWRNTYRNWDLPQRRQLFAGVRVVYDL